MNYKEFPALINCKMKRPLICLSSRGAQPRWLPILILTVLMITPACGGRQHQNGTRLSGKIVAGGLAMEGASIEIYDARGPAGRTFLATTSGYHGSFSVKLPPGEYVIRATQEVLMVDKKVEFVGELTVTVPGDVRRVDRVVVELEKKGNR